MGTYAFMT